MIEIFITMLLACPIPKEINKTKVPFTKDDRDALNSAILTCHKVYYPSVCLITFTKHGYHHYSAICGDKR